MHFLDSLKEYDKDKIRVPVIKKIRDRYITNSEFDPDIVRHVSSACEGLRKWVIAVETYDEVAKVRWQLHSCGRILSTINKETFDQFARYVILEGTYVRVACISLNIKITIIQMSGGKEADIVNC